MNYKRKLIIGVLAFLVVLTMGYALFSETVTIGGTAKADGNVSLDLYNPDGSSNLTYNTKGVGSSGTAKIDQSRKTLTVTASFDYPSAYVEIPIKIKNMGSIDLYVSDININGSVVSVDGESINLLSALSNPDISGIFTYEGINRLDLIKAKTEKNIIIKTSWIEDEYGIEEVIKNINFTISISGVQEINDNDTGLPSSPYKYAIGDKITIGTENFNVIGEDYYTVTMLAQNVLTKDGLTQTTSKDVNIYGIKFKEVGPGSNDPFYGYWTDDQGYLLPEYGGDPSKGDKWYGYPINVYDSTTNPYDIVEKYVANLKKIIPTNNNKMLSGRLIYLSELVELGYPIDEYGYCSNKNYNEWLIKDQDWWTGSTDTYRCEIIYIQSDGMKYSDSPRNTYGVRPVITIDKNLLPKTK